MSALKKLVRNADGSAWVTVVCPCCYRYHQWHRQSVASIAWYKWNVPQRFCGECRALAGYYVPHGSRERSYSEEAD